MTVSSTCIMAMRTVRVGCESMTSQTQFHLLLSDESPARIMRGQTRISVCLEQQEKSMLSCS